MPAGRQPANRLLIEAELTPAELLSIADFCGLHGIPFASWHRVPLVRGFFETLAATRIVTRLRADG